MAKKKRPKRSVSKKTKSPASELSTPIESNGTVVDQIPVELSYQIIRHFSAGLYSSPNKAVEELVANAYDAWADYVHVRFSENLSSKDACICVVDNGAGMDLDDFRNLWTIGESRKRESNRDDRGRPPIGKFGIGKLATYVLAKELTYVCRKGRSYRAITMDFTTFEKHPKLRTLSLDARRLSAGEAQQVLRAPLRLDQESQPFDLFGSDAPKSWTVAVLSNLTLLARELGAGGHLRRVLQTAIPLSPQFNLYLNGQRLRSSRLDKTPIQEWTIGRNDTVADKLKFESGSSKGPHVQIPNLGRISGKVQLFADSITDGKAAKWGRSHGFFVLVRNRLINLHQELFGLVALSHGTWSRFRMVVDADGLDEYLRSTREDVAENEEGVRNFRSYLKEKFNEARSFYLNWQATKEAEKSIPNRIAGVSRSLSRQPLVDAISQVLDGRIDDLFLTRVPKNLTDDERQSLVEELSTAIDDPEFFTAVRTEALGTAVGLAVFDVSERAILINSLHPYFANYEEHYKTIEPFQLLAVTEVLTEAYLLETEMYPEDVREVLSKRDRLLRELVFSTKLAAPLVAQMLNDNKSDWKGLEDATCRGFSSLGFEVSPISGPGVPDGVAVARVGVRDQKHGPDDYTITFDSKSTAAKKIAANKIVSGTIAQHRKDYCADFSVVVAPGFEGDGHPTSNAVKQAEMQSITLITVEDFARLVLVASIRPLSFLRIRDEVLKICRGPNDIKTWIDDFLREVVPVFPLEDVMDVIWEIMEDSPDAPAYTTVADRLRKRSENYSNMRGQDIREMMQSVARFEPDLVTCRPDKVYLEQSPQNIARRVIHNATGVPAKMLKSSVFSGLLPEKKSSAATKVTKSRKRKR